MFVSSPEELLEVCCHLRHDGPRRDVFIRTEWFGVAVTNSGGSCFESQTGHRLFLHDYQSMQEIARIVP
jgi:hypothetical protein